MNKRGLGNFIEIEDRFGDSMKYYHLGEIKVSLGDKIERGQIIGISGNSGLTTINGIGLEVKRNEEIVDPLNYINLPVVN